jgi:aldehyde dehydrogenase (NAD+)
MQSILTAPTITADLEVIFKSQQNTAKLWRSSSMEQRAERIKKIQTWIKKNKSEIHQALYSDFKKPIPETDLSEIYPVVSEINHTLKHLKSWMGSKSVSTPLAMIGTKSRILFEPKGSSLIISPWNYPFNLSVAPMISALAAGCTVFLKPSEMTPNTSSLLQKMIEELFDPSEVAVAQGKADVAQALLRLPFDHIFFTGSPSVGKKVMKAAAENLTSITLELGGKSPAIVDQNSDLKDAAGKLVSGKFINCGQTCIAPDYILVHREAYSQLLMELKLAIQKMYDPNYTGIDKSPDFARLVNQAHFLRIEGFLSDAIRKGATLEFGGKTDLANCYFEPTLLTNVTDEMEVMQEEIFGPLLPIITYENLDQAIEYINGKPKPLALYYFGNDTDLINKVLKETSSGNAVINDCVLHFLHSELPFGGVNNSGMGKAHGHFGFLAFSNEKGILKQRVGMNNGSLLKPPYGPQAKGIISSLIKWF